MKHALGLTLLLVSAVLFLGSVAGFSGDDARAVAAPPPLPIEKYLHETLPEAPVDKPKLKVDNFACCVCHGNYEGEALVVEHGMEKIGCIDCHGESLDHRNDEDNITPPGKMYPLEEVDKMCGACHHKHNVSAREVIERWQQRCPEKTNPKKIVCTDCHFQHRLQRRTVRWNKKTGEVIIRRQTEGAQLEDDLTSPGEQKPNRSRKGD